METYIIQDLNGFGYWDNTQNSLRGVFYATHYYSKDEAIIVAKTLSSLVTIITVYNYE